MRPDVGVVVQVNVLGSVGIWRNGVADVELGTRLRRLLAALAVANGSVVSADRLVEIVWAGEPPAGADKTLRSYVTRLRQALDSDRDELIVFRQPGYALHLLPGELDSDVFDDELDRALQHLRTADATTAAQVLATAIDRWRGPAYAGFADEEWARPESVRLEERLVEAREALVEARLADGLTEQAVSEAQALVESEPLRERPRVLLMRSLYTGGRQAEALRVYSTYRRYLAEETGLDPSEKIAELEGRIARSDAGLGGPSQMLRGYEVGERIGEGAFAVVHRAVQPGIDRDVAVKIIRAELADQPDFIRRFELEAQTVARLEHPNVVPLYDFWREPGAAYLVMRWLRGGSVEQALRANGPYSRKQTMRLVDDVGGALDTAHRAGVVHRDVRPANLLLDTEGTTYLADFGIALPAATADHLPIVSPAYAAPEVLRGEPAGISADVLSLGVTVFELLTGRLPFADSNERAEVVRRQLSEPLPPVRATRTDLPAVVDDVLARATAKAAGDRYATVGAFVGELEAALRIDAARPIGRRTLVAAGQIVENPYVGLHAFDEPDADRFFGRETLVAELVDAMEQRPMVVVVGPSGSGKSSVVRAGLLPAIRRGAVPGSDQWFVTTMMPGTDPIDALETALLRVAVNPPATLREQLADPGGLLRAIRRVLPDDHSRILLVIDQFEELFTQVHDHDERDRFLTELAAAITHPASPLRVVATLRADHYDAPLRHPGMADIVTDGTVTVRPMTPDELERAISLPAGSVGVEVEPALAAELVAGITARPAALPLLQFALTELFDRRVSDLMLLSTHRELGGLTGALAARAERILHAGGADDEAEMRRIFGRLVTLGEGVEDTRRRALRSEFGDGERTAWLLDAFVSARLLATDRDPTTREPTVEVAHEALLRDWPRLRGWLADDRADLGILHAVVAATAAWVVAGGEPSEFARGGRLETAADLAQRHSEWLNDVEAEWVTASTRAAEAEATAQAEAIEHDRRQNRRLRGLLTAAVILLVVALGAALGALVLRNRAVDSENAAQNARKDTDIERLVALSASEINTDPGRAILLALHANRLRDDVSTRTAVHRAIATDPRIVGLFPETFDESTMTALSDDGRVGVTATVGTGRVQWFDGTNTVALDPIYEAPALISQLALAGDGSVTALGLADRSVIFVDGTGSMIGTPIQLEGVIERLALDGDGDTVAVIADTMVAVADVASGEVRATYAVEEDRAPFWIALSRDGRQIAVSVFNPFPGPSEVDSVDIIDAATGERLNRFESPAGFIAAMALAVDGRLITGHDDGRVAVRAVDGSDEPTVFGAHAGQILHVEGASDGRIITAADETVRVWNGDGTISMPRLSLPGEVGAAVIRSDGQLILARRSDGYVIVDPGASAVVEAVRPVPYDSQIDADMPYYDSPADNFVNLLLMDLETGEIVREIDLTDVQPNGLSAPPRYSSDGGWVLTTAPNEGSLAWTEILGDRQYVHSIYDLYESVFGVRVDGFFPASLRWRPDGRLLLVASGPDGVWQAAWFDGATGEIVAGPIETGAGGFVRVLGDGRVVLGSSTAPLTVLSADLASSPTVIEGSEGLEALHEDRTSGLVLVGGEAGALGLLDPDEATLEPIEGATGQIYAGAFSPSGDTIAVVSFEDGVQLFDVATRQRLGIPMFVDGIGFRGGRGLRWSEDGTGVWVAPAGGPVRFAADPGRWIERACEIVHRELSLDEWRAFVSPTTEPVPACDRSTIVGGG